MVPALEILLAKFATSIVMVAASIVDIALVLKFICCNIQVSCINHGADRGC